MVHEITTANSEVLRSGVVLVDFWAPWCGPCRVIAPTVEELGKEYDTVAKVNTDEQQQLTVDYGIRTIPTVLILKDGVVVDQLLGVRPKQEYVEALNKVLNQ